VLEGSNSLYESSLQQQDCFIVDNAKKTFGSFLVFREEKGFSDLIKYDSVFEVFDESA